MPLLLQGQCLSPGTTPTRTLFQTPGCPPRQGGHKLHPLTSGPCWRWQLYLSLEELPGAILPTPVSACHVKPGDLKRYQVEMDLVYKTHNQNWCEKKSMGGLVSDFF